MTTESTSNKEELKVEDEGEIASLLDAEGYANSIDED